MTDQKEFKSGFVSILGRPNVGKSTLLNAIVGEKISITTAKPQTTRNRITGIKNLPNAQIVFWDTPGIHKAKDVMNRIMVKTALSTISEVDILVFIIEADKSFGSGDEFILSLLRESEKPVVLVINKIDLVKKEALLPLIESVSKRLEFKAIVPLSAKKEEGVEQLLETLSGLLEAGPQYFPDDLITDRPERFIVAEMVREKIFEKLQQEIPYQTAVEVEEFNDEKEGVVVIRALIYVDRDAHKRIIIGKRGGMLKTIGTLARKEMERLLGARVFLELFVKVKKGWSSSGRMLKELGLED